MAEADYLCLVLVCIVITEASYIVGGDVVDDSQHVLGIFALKCKSFILLFSFFSFRPKYSVILGHDSGSNLVSMKSYLAKNERT